MRLLVAVLLFVVLVGAAYVAYLNSEAVTFHFGPTETVTLPMAGALAGAFGTGAVLVALMWLLASVRRGWHGMRQQRRARKAIRHAEQTARARQLAWTGEYDQARAAILRSERGVPAEVGRIEIVAESYLREGNLDGAADLLDSALDAHPHDVRLLDLLATVAVRRGDEGRAVEILERARRNEPSSPRLMEHLRDRYVQAGRWADALALQDELIGRLKSPERLEHEEGILRGLRYEVARAEADPERGAKLLGALGREHPRFVPAWVAAGERYLEAGKPAKARKVWERGAAHVPADPLLDRLEALDAGESAADRTTKTYRALLRSHHGDALLRQRLVRHLLAIGAGDDAVHELDALGSATNGGPQAAQAALRGEALRQRGEYEQAAATFSRALGPSLGLATAYRCTACDAEAAGWSPTCSQCHGWGTVTDTRDA